MLITHCIEKIGREIRLLAWLPKCSNSSQVNSVRWYVLQSVSSLIGTRVSMGLWGKRLWEQVVRSFPEAIASQRQKCGTLADAEPGGHRVCCCAPQHTYTWLSSAVAHTYSHHTQRQQKSVGCSTKLHSWKTKGIFRICFIGSVQKYSRDVVLLLPLFWNTSSGPCSMLGVKSVSKLFPLLGYEIFHSLVPDEGEE